jgi:hypothetical protein
VIFLLLYAPIAVYVGLLGLGLFRWKRIDSSQRLIPLYEGICIATTLGIELLKALHLSPSFLVHVFSPVQTLLFGEVFAQSVGSIKVRRWLRGLAYGYLLFWLVWVGTNGMDGFGTYRNPVFHIHTTIDLLLALICLAERSLDYRTTLTSRATFWIASGFLLDSALCLVLYPARDWLQFNRPDILNMFNASRAVLVMVTHVLYGKALLCPPRTRSS